MSPTCKGSRRICACCAKSRAKNDVPMRSSRRPQRPTSARCIEAASPLAVAPAEQEHRLLAEQVPEPPWCIEPQRASPGVECERAFHLGAGRQAQVAEVLDGA